MTVVELVLLVAATARVTKLVVDDGITQPLRTAVARRAFEWRRNDYVTRSRSWRWVWDLITCAWCIGFWISVLAVAGWYLWGDTTTWTLATLVLALSFLQAALVGLVTRDGP